MVSDGSKMDVQQLQFPLHLEDKELTIWLIQSVTENKDKQNSDVEMNFVIKVSYKPDNSDLTSSDK